jgi:hypothetical protein
MAYSPDGLILPAPVDKRPGTTGPAAKLKMTTTFQGSIDQVPPALE